MQGTSGTRPWKGLDTTRMPVFIGYDQAERMVTALLHQAEPWGPDAVAGIARGGMVPATMAACTLALPLFTLGWDRASASTAWIGPQPEGRRLLLVDDCCATGATMRSVRTALRDQGWDCLTLTIVHDPETTCYVPDLSHPMRPLFRFPWERGEATPTARALRATGAASDRSTEAPFVGLDLDGVFLPDIPLAEYRADLAAALARRRTLPPHPRLPHFAPDRAVVITGRPASDHADTAAWLAACGHGALPVECRPSDVADSPEAVARYKAVAATRWGCTHFVESDPVQAIRIAAEAPHLVVTWWSADEARGWLLGVAAHPAGS